MKVKNLEEFERCKADNLKLRTDMHKIRKHFAQLLKLICPLKSKTTKTTKQQDFARGCRLRKSYLKNQNKSCPNDRTKRSSKNVFNSTENESINSIATADISSILSVVNSINNTLLTSDRSGRLSSTETSLVPSITSTSSGNGSMYHTASMSSSMEHEQNGLECSIELSIPSDSDLSMDMSDSCESNSLNTTQNLSNSIAPSEIVRNMSHSIAPMFQSQLISRNNISESDMIMSNNLFHEKSFVENIHDNALIGQLEMSQRERNENENIAEDSMVSLEMVQSIATARSSLQYQSICMSHGIDLSVNINSSHHLGTQQHSSDFHISIDDGSYYTNYTNVYNTLYMKSVAKYVGEKLAKKYDQDITNDKVLINEYLSESQRNSLIEECSCCLCKKHLKINDTLKLCMSQHPIEEACKNGQPKRKNNQSKYIEYVICDHCMPFMTLNSKRNKNKKFPCCFESCSIELKTKLALQNHYLKHLKVKNFVCPICPKAYSSKSGLKMHERQHAIGKSSP